MSRNGSSGSILCAGAALAARGALAFALCAQATVGQIERVQAQAATAPAAQPAAVPSVPSVEQQYATLIRDALAEMSAQHYPEALGLFQKAHALQPSARTERGLGSVEFELRHYTLAAAHFRNALTSSVRALNQAMRAEAEQALARAESYTGFLFLVLTPANGVLKVDGQAIAPASDGSVWLDVGEHDVLYQATGYQPQRQSVSITSGQRVELTLSLTAQPLAGPNLAVAATPPAKSPSLLSRWWFWTAAGVVVTGAVVGIAVATSGEEAQPPIAGNLGATQSVLRVRP